MLSKNQLSGIGRGNAGVGIAWTKSEIFDCTEQSDLRFGGGVGRGNGFDIQIKRHRLA